MDMNVNKYHWRSFEYEQITVNHIMYILTALNTANASFGLKHADINPKPPYKQTSMTSEATRKQAKPKYLVSS